MIMFVNINVNYLYM